MEPWLGLFGFCVFFGAGMRMVPKKASWPTHGWQMACVASWLGCWETLTIWHPHCSSLGGVEKKTVAHYANALPLDTLLGNPSKQLHHGSPLAGSHLPGLLGSTKAPVCFLK